MYRTRNGGESWKETGARHFATEVNLAYNNTIAVHPKDPEFVLAGAKNLHLTLDGGRSWKRVSTDRRDGTGDKLPRNFVHPDHHSVIITPTGMLYSGNDGGVARSENRGVTWQTSSEGMVTAMFYAAGVSQRDSRIFGGGTQDNGTLIAGVPDTAGAPAPPEGHFTRVLAGDGGWIEFDPNHTEHVFGSTSDLILNRHRKGEPWANGTRLAKWTNVSPPKHLLLPGEKEARSIIVMEMAGRRLYCGTSRLWRTDIHRQTWKPVSPFLDGSAISAIEVSPHDPAVLFAGTSLGCIFRSCDGGGTWSSNLAGPAVAQRVITRIAIHPAQPRTVVIAVAATGNPGARLVRSDDPDQSGETTPYSHVLLSNDLGQTWLPLETGDHPDVVINAVVFETHPPYRLFVGGDAGVWFREDVDPRSVGGFIAISGNMPNVVVSDLSFHHNDKFLYAATYGRGIWRWKVDGASPEAESFDDRTHRDSPPAVGLIPHESAPAPKLLSPPDGAVIAFPGTTTLKWTPVPGAIAYSIETVHPDGRTSPFSSPVPELTFESHGREQIFWRVWAILPDSKRSPGSKSRKLRYSG